ncbi:flagellar biosynthesis protein FlhF [Thiobacillus denitrificans]|uniref:flagellar biosynthesis protein FlhF n=1 Tax=Thiobacillus denitrificans TaxID=36861 RepID=UPI00035D35BF|nr:flagellar biosynthesis protein FlhF [Thiobacillus denitrificans]
MNVKRIVAKTSREAMRQLRDALGPDAIILANRAVEGGVEVLALAAEDIASMAPPVVEAPATSAPAKTPAAVVQDETEAAPAVTIKRRLVERVAVPSADSTQLAQSVINEIKTMQMRLESQLADLAWRDLPGRDPAGAAVMRDMLAAGFSATLARELLEAMPKGDVEQVQSWTKNTLMNRLQVMQSETDMLDGGGVFALMGPTGAGKTTTTAKLAARFVVRHGADKLALLTTDSYRIGGHEQLRIYGKILGVAVHAVRDAADLRLALSELRNKHTVLIDTVGMSQRDQAVAEQVEMLCQAGKPIKRLLLLNATSHGDTLDEVVQAYRTRGLDGCILSKIDEAASLGPALDCAIRHQLCVHYLATGQRVPEDLHLANRQYLIHRAFKARTHASPWQLDDSELAFALSGMQAAHRESVVALG